MKQARIPNEQEYKRLLAVISTGRYAARNRMAFMFSYAAGMRVGEIAALKIGDVLDRDGIVRDQIQLRPEQTKGDKHRMVFVSKKLQKEIRNYVKTLRNVEDVERPLLTTQKRQAFTANVLCQLFGQLYRQAGIDCASSHSGRRAFITNLSQSGISVKIIASLAGHRSIQTTARYISVTDDMMRNAVEVI